MIAKDKEQEKNKERFGIVADTQKLTVTIDGVEMEYTLLKKHAARFLNEGRQPT
jgi:hypothetical protein